MPLFDFVILLLYSPIRTNDEFWFILIFRGGDYMFTDERWRAIVQNDASYNDKFYYAGKTTKV
ncbi:Ada metal-binding domain-containing protein [Paenibacillus elgii]